MRDLQSPKWIYLKAGLFGLIVLVSGFLLFAAHPTAQTALLLAALVWSSCRSYYFAFYVIEKYVDPSFRFSGLGAAAAYLWGKLREK